MPKGALAAKSVLTHLALQKENNGVVSARQRHPCFLKVLAFLMVPVLELQTVHIWTLHVPAAIQNMFLRAIKQRGARKPSLDLVRRDFAATASRGQLSTVCQETESVCPFATSPGAPAARSAWTGLAAREKAGPATVRMKRLPCPKDRASSMTPVPSLLGPLTLEPVPVAKMMSPPQHHLVTQQINAKLPIQEQD